MSAAWTARPDAIIVRNSLDARLDTCMTQLTPTLRALMFCEDERRAKEIAESRAKAMKAMRKLGKGRAHIVPSTALVT